VPHAVGPGS